MPDAVAVAEYSRAQKVLHWTVALLILLQFLFFEEMSRPFDRLMQTGVSDYTATVVGHIAIGASVFALALWRLALRAANEAPVPPAREPNPARAAGRATHVALYVVLVSLPLLGLGAWFLPSETLGEAHQIGTNVLLWLIGLHVLAVALHQFWWKTGLLRRMT